jgi:hypothetical protein
MRFGGLREVYFPLFPSVVKQECCLVRACSRPPCFLCPRRTDVFSFLESCISTFVDSLYEIHPPPVGKSSSTGPLGPSHRHCLRKQGTTSTLQFCNFARRATSVSFWQSQLHQDVKSRDTRSDYVFLLQWPSAPLTTIRERISSN